MPRTSARGGPQTRARVAEVANRLFIDRGFDAVTVAEVAREAGVSSVTVFNHFPTKEDLFYDRTDEAEELLRSTVRDRPTGTSAVAALRTMTLHLAEERLPLSGIDPRSTPFFRTVAASPALVARARSIGAQLQGALAEELERDAELVGEARLLAAFFIAGYTTVLVETARHLIGGAEPDSVLDDHADRLRRLFDALESSFPG